MSHEPSHATEHMEPPAAQADEGVAWGKVFGVGVGWTILFVVAVWIVVRFLHAREKELQPNGPDPMPVQMGQVEIGIVDQVPFDVTRALQQYRADRLDKLDHWGWVDKKAGVVRMPIEEAMDRVVKEHHK